MSQSPPRLDSVRLDEEIVELLSEIFKNFKNQFFKMQKMVLLHTTLTPQYDAQEQLIMQLKGLIKEEQYIIQKLISHRKLLGIFKTTFYRLFSRLIELVNKYNKKSNIKQFEVLYQYYQSIELIIYNAVSNENDEYFETLLQICELSRKFTIKLLSRFSVDYDDSRMVTLQQIIFDKESQKQQLSKSSSPGKGTTIQTQMNATKYEKKLNEFYKNLNCLDLDYNYFKNGFYSARSHQNDVYDQTLGRNQFVRQEIDNYKNDYNNYKLRKSKNSRRVKKKNCSELGTVVRNLKTKIKENEMMSLSTFNPQMVVQSSSKSRDESKQMKLFSGKKRSQKYRNGMNQTSRNIFFDEQIKMSETITTNNNYFKFSAKLNLQPKKVFLNMNKLSLKPLELQKQPISPSKKRNMLLFNSSDKKKVNQIFQVIIQGHKINDFQIRKYDTRNQAQRNFISNLFT